MASFILLSTSTLRQVYKGVLPRVHLHGKLQYPSHCRSCLNFHSKVRLLHDSTLVRHHHRVMENWCSPSTAPFFNSNRHPIVDIAMHIFCSHLNSPLRRIFDPLAPGISRIHFDIERRRILLWPGNYGTWISQP